MTMHRSPKDLPIKSLAVWENMASRYCIPEDPNKDIFSTTPVIDQGNVTSGVNTKTTWKGGDTTYTCEFKDYSSVVQQPKCEPLSEDEIKKCYEQSGHCQTLRPQDIFVVIELARAIEKAHGIGI